MLISHANAHAIGSLPTPEDDNGFGKK